MIIIDSAAQYLALRESGALDPVVVQGREYAIAIPCVNTLLAARDMVRANTYNPNTVPRTKLALLMQSIIDNGFAYPIAVIYDDDSEVFVIIDGFHRHLVTAAEYLELPYVPVVVLNHDMAQRMIATIQFNKARGFHQVDLDAEVVRALLEQGLAEEDVATHLGMDLDTVYRYKQVTGIAALFVKADYSMAWEMAETETAAEEEANG